MPLVLSESSKPFVNSLFKVNCTLLPKGLITFTEVTETPFCRVKFEGISVPMSIASSKVSLSSVVEITSSFVRDGAAASAETLNTEFWLAGVPPFGETEAAKLVYSKHGFSGLINSIEKPPLALVASL